MTISFALVSKLDQCMCLGLNGGVTAGKEAQNGSRAVAYRSQKKCISVQSNLGNTMLEVWRAAQSSRFCHKTVARRAARAKIWTHFRPSGKAVMVLNKNTAL